MVFTIAMIGIVVLMLGFAAVGGLISHEQPVGDELSAFAPVPPLLAERQRPQPFFVPSAAGSDKRPLDDACIALLLSILEGHVRREQAAVDSFLRRPTVERLRSSTTSPLAN